MLLLLDEDPFLLLGRTPWRAKFVRLALCILFFMALVGLDVSIGLLDLLTNYRQLPFFIELPFVIYFSDLRARHSPLGLFVCLGFVACRSWRLRAGM